MRYLDMHSWPRRRHFEMFNAFDYPHFALCAPVDITSFYAAVKERGASFNLAAIYALSRVANAIPEFRYRIRGVAPDVQVVEHEVVHPSSTVLTPGDLFSFCKMPYEASFTAFAARAAQAIARVQANPTLEDEPGQDDLLFMTSIPWVAFTNITHPIHMHPVDSTPRIAWGQFYAEGERLKLPLSVQAHHALLDGVHVGRYYQQVQELLATPDFL